MCRGRTGVAWVTARYPCRWTNIPTLVHLAGLEPARAPGLSRLPLPIGLQMRWSGRWASLPPPPAWRAGALLNELLPDVWRVGLGAARPAPSPTRLSGVRYRFVVDPAGLEPAASAMPLRRAPGCATGPCGEDGACESRGRRSPSREHTRVRTWSRHVFSVLLYLRRAALFLVELGRRGSSTRNRTWNIRVNSAALCRLSYRGSVGARGECCVCESRAPCKQTIFTC